MLTALGFCTAGVVGVGLWCVYKRVFFSAAQRKKGGQGIMKYWGFGFLGRKKGANKKEYELVDRHEV